MIAIVFLTDVAIALGCATLVQLASIKVGVCAVGHEERALQSVRGGDHDKAQQGCQRRYEKAHASAICAG